MNRNRTDAAAMDTDTLRRVLANHDACVAAGVNVGEIQRNKATAWRMELATRDSLARLDSAVDRLRVVTTEQDRRWFALVQDSVPHRVHSQ